MGKMLISLDEQSWSWLEAQAGDAETYVNALVHQDQLRKAAEAELRDMLDEADASGISDRSVDQIWDEAKARHLARYA